MVLTKRDPTRRAVRASAPRWQRWPRCHRGANATPLAYGSRLPPSRCRKALSLLELLSAVTILGVLAAIALPRTTGAFDKGKATSCHINQAEIELQCRLWYRMSGSWPATNLVDIGADLNYFPESVPTCPVDGTTYTIDSFGKVVGHSH